MRNEKSISLTKRRGLKGYSAMIATACQVTSKIVQLHLCMGYVLENIETAAQFSLDSLTFLL
jgi:hypothetical protein